MEFNIIGPRRITKKLLALDFDHTLVRPKSGSIFPTNADDWTWFAPQVPEIIADFYRQGFMIVIFTNQSKAFKKTQIYNVMNTLYTGYNISSTVIIATEKQFYKPNFDLYKLFVQIAFSQHPHSLYDNIAHSPAQLFDQRIFVGDALGRSADFSNTDLLFGEALMCEILPPEKFFTAPPCADSPMSLVTTKSLDEQVRAPADGDTLCTHSSSIKSLGFPWDLNFPNMRIAVAPSTVCRQSAAVGESAAPWPQGESAAPSAVVLVGLPGAGKSTVCRAIVEQYGDSDVNHILRDYCKSVRKMLGKFEQFPAKITLFDATNPSVESRKVFVDAMPAGTDIICIHVNTPLDIAAMRNNMRAERVPPIALCTYKKKFELPSFSEGFSSIITIE